MLSRPEKQNPAAPQNSARRSDVSWWVAGFSLPGEMQFKYLVNGVLQRSKDLIFSLEPAANSQILSTIGRLPLSMYRDEADKE